MLRQYPTMHKQSPWKLLVGVLCIALVVLGPMMTLRGDPEKARPRATDQADGAPMNTTSPSRTRR